MAQQTYNYHTLPCNSCEILMVFSDIDGGFYDKASGADGVLGVSQPGIAYEERRMCIRCKDIDVDKVARSIEQETGHLVKCLGGMRR